MEDNMTKYVLKAEPAKMQVVHKQKQVKKDKNKGKK